MHMFTTSPFPQSKVTHLSSELSDKISNEECLKYIIKMSLHHAPALAAYLTFDITSDKKGHVVTIGAVPIRFNIEVTAEIIIEALLAKRTELPLPSFEETHRSLLLKLNAIKEQLNQVGRLKIRKQKADLTLELAQLSLLPEATERDKQRNDEIQQEIAEIDKKAKEKEKSDTKQYTITLSDIILRARKHLELMNTSSLAAALGQYLHTSEFMEELKQIEFREKETLIISKIYQAYPKQNPSDEILESNQFNQLLYEKYAEFHNNPIITETGKDFIEHFKNLEPVTFNRLDEIIVYNLFNGHIPQLLTLRILSFIAELQSSPSPYHNSPIVEKLNILTKDILSLFIGLLHGGSGDAIPKGNSLESSRAYISSKPNSGHNTLFNQSAFLTAITLLNTTFSESNDVLKACNDTYRAKNQGIFTKLTGLTRASEATRTDTFCMVTDDTENPVDIYTLFLCKLSTATPNNLNHILQSIATQHRKAWLKNITDISASLERKELSALNNMPAADILNSTLGSVLDNLLQSSAEEAAILEQSIVLTENTHSALTMSVAKKSLKTSLELAASSVQIAKFSHQSKEYLNTIDAQQKEILKLKQQYTVAIENLTTAESRASASDTERVEVCDFLSTLAVKSALEALPNGEDILQFLRERDFFDDTLLTTKPSSP